MGTVHAFNGSNPSKDQFTGAIVQWVNTRKVAEALTREQIGALSGFDRIDALRKASTIHAVMRCRTNPRADCTEAVVRLIEIMSDNDKGICTMSQDRMAAILCRSRRAIVGTIGRLRDAGTILTADQCGKKSGYMIAIPPELACQNHRLWLIEALESTCEADFTGDASRTRRVKSTSHVKLSATCESDFTRHNEKSQPSRDEPVKSSAPTCEVRLHPSSLRDSTKQDGDLFGDLSSTAAREPAFKAAPPNVPDAALITARAATVAGMIVAAAAAGFPAKPANAAGAENNPAPIVQPAPQVPSCWLTPKATMDAATSLAERAAQMQVWITSTGAVEVADDSDFASELKHAFPLVDRACGLAAAGANIQAGRGALAAMQIIRRQFAYMQGDAKRKAERDAAMDKNWRDRQAGKSLDGKESFSIVKKNPTATEWRNAMILWSKKAIWPSWGGPKPNESGCCVPAEILGEFSGERAKA